MQDLLIKNDLYYPILGDASKPDDMKDKHKEWEYKHLKAVSLIRTYIDDSILHHVIEEKKADVLWKKLSTMYEIKAPVNKVPAIKKLMRLIYNENQSMSKHLSNFQDMVNQLASAKITFEDEILALLLMGTLPDSFETLVITLSNSAPGGKISLESVKEALMNEEVRRKEKYIASSSSGAYVSQNRGRSKNHGRQDHRSKSRTGQGNRSQSRGRETRKCFHCGRVGHLKNQCRVWKKEKKQTGQF